MNVELLHSSGIVVPAIFSSSSRPSSEYRDTSIESNVEMLALRAVGREKERGYSLVLSFVVSAGVRT